MRKSSSFISNLSINITNKEYNQNFDFINQNYNHEFDNNKIDKQNDEKYVKVKYLKGKR